MTVQILSCRYVVCVLLSGSAREAQSTIESVATIVDDHLETETSETVLEVLYMKRNKRNQKTHIYSHHLWS